MLAPDVIHSNGLKTHILAGWARPPRTPVIWHIHDYLRLRFVSSRLLRSQAGKAARRWRSPRAWPKTPRRYWEPGPPCMSCRTVSISTTISPHGPALSLDRLAGLPATPPGTAKVGLIASFARWKGHHVFLRALSELPASVAVRGYVVGGPLYDTAGSERTLEELSATVERLWLRGRVGLVGFVDDAAAAMRGLDVVVHASTLAEPFGLVIVDTMATRRPVIVSLAGGRPAHWDLRGGDPHRRVRKGSAQRKLSRSLREAMAAGARTGSTRERLVERHRHEVWRCGDRCCPEGDGMQRRSGVDRAHGAIQLAQGRDPCHGQMQPGIKSLIARALFR